MPESVPLFGEELTASENRSTLAGLAQISDGTVSYESPEELRRHLEGMWNPDYLVLRESGFYLPEWYVGMTTEFTKSVVRAERTMQGRILKALAEITRNPITPKGDTIRPLTHEREGLWRYRIGNFRIVYQPDEETGHITLLAFASRGDVYGK